MPHAHPPRPHRASRSGRFRRGVGVAVAAAAFASPATAMAADSYVVTLTPAAATSCQQSITSVTADYALTPTATYTSALCGFSTSMSRNRADRVAADFRVQSVTLDGVIVGA